jgi:hypothetical protein
VASLRRVVANNMCGARELVLLGDAGCGVCWPAGLG